MNELNGRIVEVKEDFEELLLDIAAGEYADKNQQSIQAPLLAIRHKLRTIELMTSNQTVSGVVENRLVKRTDLVLLDDIDFECKPMSIERMNQIVSFISDNSEEHF